MKQPTRHWIRLSGHLLVCVSTIAAQTGRAVPGEFGPNGGVETFEGQLLVTLDQDFIPFDGGTLPFGTVDLGHAFSTGVTLSAQSPAPGHVVLYDWSVPFFYNQPWNLASAGAIYGTTSLPSGTSFLAHSNLVNGEALGLTLPVGAYRVGCFVEARDFDTVTLRAYDVLGSLLGAEQVTPDGVDGSGLDAFLGIASHIPIASIEFAGSYVALDDLAFDPDPALIYGRGCSGSGGHTPSLHVGGATQAGAPVDIEVSNGLGGSAALLLVGTTQVDVLLGASCSLLVSPILTSVVLPLAGSGHGNGAASLTASIPASLPTGATLTLQAWVVDPAAALGAASSNGIALTVLP